MTSTDDKSGILPRVNAHVRFRLSGKVAEMSRAHAHERTPKIAVLTGNEAKGREYAATLGRYGIRPTMVVPDVDADAQVTALLDSDHDYVIREESRLVRMDGGQVGPGYVGTAVNLSDLVVTTAEGRWTDTASVPGYVDPGQATKGTDQEAWFGWDDVFVQASTGLTYREASLLGLKSSARDVTLGRFIDRCVRYEIPVDIRFAPVEHGGGVDFGVSVVDHMRKSPLVRAAFQGSREGGVMDRLLGSVLQDGVFFRSATSRRDRNYWLPGLNGGVPLVPKKDGVHELTFMMHDILHWASPDLVHDGRQGASARMVYVLHRMIGEAVSMVAADYVFADLLSRAGIEYDFAQRKIHPMFASIDRSGGVHHDRATFKALAWANVNLALLGDEYPMLSRNVDHDALTAFRAKYDRFFVEDYRWSARNIDHMASTEAASGVFSRWASVSGDAMATTNVATVGGFIDRHGLNRIIEVPYPSAVAYVFEATMKDFFDRHLAAGAPTLSTMREGDATRQAFRRYMIGQSFMCWRYGHVARLERLGTAILDALPQVRDEADMARVRGLHDLAVDTLLHAGAISPEDARTYRQVAPVFDPFFVFYDAKDAPLKSIPEAVRHVFPNVKGFA